MLPLLVAPKASEIKEEKIPTPESVELTLVIVFAVLIRLELEYCRLLPVQKQRGYMYVGMCSLCSVVLKALLVGGSVSQ